MRYRDKFTAYTLLVKQGVGGRSSARSPSDNSYPFSSRDHFAPTRTFPMMIMVLGVRERERERERGGEGGRERGREGETDRQRDRETDGQTDKNKFYCYKQSSVVWNRVKNVKIFFQSFEKKQKGDNQIETCWGFRHGGSKTNFKSLRNFYQLIFLVCLRPRSPFQRSQF